MLPSSSLELPDSQRGITAAANAAASWVRAQRASRSEAALGDSAGLVPTVELEDEHPVEGQDFPSAVERAGVWLRSLPARVWLTSVGVIAIAAVLAVVGSSITEYRKSAQRRPTIERPVGPVAPVAARAAVPVRKMTGRLQISSEPPAARVLVDGRFRGMTPLTLDDLELGEHAIVLESAEGSVRRTVTIAGSEPVVLEERIFSGWIAVYSPFDLIVSEGATAFALDDRHQIMLPPGPHELRLENRALGYDEIRHVDVKPGGVVTLQVTPPRSALTVKATADAQVWVDGVLAGDTPLVAFSVTLGTHEVIVKRAGDERRFIVTSTVKPVDLSVDFSKPGT
jgi:hypothetical protein